MVPRLLNEDQKEHCMQVCQEITEGLQIEPALHCGVITGNATSIFQLDAETKRQSCEWKSQRSETVKVKTHSHVDHAPSMNRLQRIYATGPDGQSASLQGDSAIRSVSEKRPDLLQDKSSLPHHHNAYNAVSIWQFLTEKNKAVLEQHPYLLDLALYDFFLFSRPKRVIKGTRF